jgi:hypothetical protein
MSALFDPGLQPERTELSWRRTVLAYGVGSLIAMRVLPAAFGSAWWALLGAAGFLAAAALWVIARRRARRTTGVLLERRDGPLPGAGPLAFVVGLAMATAVVALAVVLVAGLP